jgi:hypothetical protein
VGHAKSIRRLGDVDEAMCEWYPHDLLADNGADVSRIAVHISTQVGQAHRSKPEDLTSGAVRE